MTEANKYDANKLPWDLLPVEAVEQVVRVLAFGAERYGKNNWRSGMDWSRLYAATMRHLAAWQMGEKTDPDSDIHHLAHAVCNLLFLISYSLIGIGNDDRQLPIRFIPTNSMPDISPESDTFRMLRRDLAPGGDFEFSVPADHVRFLLEAIDRISGRAETRIDSQ